MAIHLQKYNLQLGPFEDQLIPAALRKDLMGILGTAMLLVLLPKA